MAVAFGAAGSGNSGSGGSLTPGYPAGMVSGDLMLLHVIIASTAETATTPAGFDKLSGPDDFSGARCYLFAKIATGSEAGTLTVSFSAANFKFARIYSFTGNETSTTAAATEDLTVSTGADNSVEMPTVDTTQNGSMAVGMTSSDSTSATGNATGETGGDWTKAVAEYQTGIGQLQIQTAAMASGGTISGGSYSSGTGTIWLMYGIGVKPAGAGAGNIAWVTA